MAHHIFEDCVVARMLWFGTLWPIRSDEIDCKNIEDFLRLLLGDVNCTNTEDSICSVALYDRNVETQSACRATDATWRSPVLEDVVLMRELGFLVPGWHTIYQHHALNALDAELKAIHMGLGFAKEFGWNTIVILSDA
ncbi:hypothetical protein PanWU01x14_318160 [Parasponia andersonii]|uniref:Uncharacterized protein n=1 Tax=Parasponia andersonii TaxID=3476 RepID=A0A2P5AMD4_PARAD|nr:hypothetical protein PanWU01x14_318160 [Parasponia andersonii]